MWAYIRDIASPLSVHLFIAMIQAKARMPLEQLSSHQILHRFQGKPTTSRSILPSQPV
jgi:hypothetical protein